MLFYFAEKIKLSVNLYDNAITEVKGDYVAKRTEYRKETIVNILDLAGQEKVNAIAEGKSVVAGGG